MFDPGDASRKTEGAGARPGAGVADLQIGQMKTSLAIFAKMPRPGGVKTRLVPPLTATEAAAVHEACLRDVVARARTVTDDLRVFHDGVAGAREYFEQGFPDLPLESQAVGDLGARLDDAFERMFAAGSQRAVIIGADSPTMPESVLAESLSVASDSDVLLGPAMDGGYYLVSLRKASWPRARTLFMGIDWSTERVLEQTLDRAEQAGLGWTLLDPWYDIDRIEDLRLAAEHTSPDSHLAALIRSARIVGLNPRATPVRDPLIDAADPHSR